MSMRQFAPEVQLTTDPGFMLCCDCKDNCSVSEPEVIEVRSRMQFHLLMDVNEWIDNECAEFVLPHMNIRDWCIRSHPSKGENCSEIARVDGRPFRQQTLHGTVLLDSSFLRTCCQWPIAIVAFACMVFFRRNVFFVISKTCFLFLKQNIVFCSQNHSEN